MRPLERQRRIAQRAVGDGNRRAADHVICELVPNQNTQRIGTSIVTDGKSDHRLGIAKGTAPSCRLAALQAFESRCVNRRNPIFRRTSGADFCEWDVMPREIGPRPF
jgi:hypothetical protein